MFSVIENIPGEYYEINLDWRDDSRKPVMVLGAFPAASN